MAKKSNQTASPLRQVRARQNDAPRVYVGFWTEPKMKSAIQEEADSFRRSVSQHLCAIVEDHFFRRGRR